MTDSPNKYDSVQDNISSEEIHNSIDIETQETITLEEVSGSDSKTELTVRANGKTYYKKRKRRKKKKKSGKFLKILNRIFIGIFSFIILAVVIGYSAFVYMKAKGKEELLPDNENVTINTVEDAVTEDSGHTVTYKGDTYKLNENLISIVIMGVDKSELDAEIYGTAGQADAIYIFTYDTESKKCSLISVSRELMTDVRIFSTDGAPVGLEKMQLCLAYAYGDGQESSCTNTLEALSRAFYNIPFTNYAALNWDSIEPLNDLIGGVTVKAVEDVITQHSHITKGETITLMGKDAWSYVKYRNTDKLESNPDRLKRQKQYINGYLSTLIPMAQNDISIISDLYDTATQYMCTNLSRNKVVYIASDIVPNVYSTKDINFYNISGEIIQGEKYAEFYADETSLYETILNVFYTKEIKK